MTRLTPQQVRFYRDIGYLRLPGKIEDDLVSQVRRLVSAEFERMPADIRTEKVYRLYEENPTLMGALIRHHSILDPLCSLLGQHIVFAKNRHNCGILHGPGRDEVPRPHRDALQWSRTFVTVLVYLEDSRLENGCTHVIPGSHLIPFVDSGATGGTWMDEHEQYSDLAEQAIPIPMPKGSALAIDATAFHSAGRNLGTGTRASVALAYRSVDELDAHSSAQHTVLVSGEHLYRGNDSEKQLPRTGKNR